ncbi:MAG: serine/threonine protein kinase, partial [Bacteroidia bacterium]
MKPEKPESSDEATGNESFVRKAAFESEAPANADETQTGLPKGDASKGPLPTGTKRVVPAAPLAEGIAPAGRGEGASAFIPPKELVPPKPRPAIKRGAPDLHIPGYQIEGVIGRGSTGTVYRARQETVDRVVALKVLHAELTKRPRMVRRLQREARTTARLAHPHIVSAIDMGRTGDRWWFAMELVDGPSLALKLRQEGRLDEREALRFFIPLCESLVHIWENGVVHRDIKPGNILIDRVSGARLADL